MVSYKEIVENGIYSCNEIQITKEEWKKILASATSTTFNALVDFVRMSGHASSCWWASTTYGKPDSSYRGCINQLGKKVANQLGLEVKNENGEIVYWIIPMKTGWTDKKTKNFVWQLRDELVQAVQEMLIEQLLHKYMDFVQSKGSLKACNELYKWELIAECKEMDIIEMAKKVGATNLVDTPRAGATLQALAREQSVILRPILQGLFDEEINIEKRLDDYKTAYSKHWKRDEYGINKPNDERSASALLTCVDPQNFTFYKSEIYEDFCEFIGEEKRSTGEKFPHYLELLKNYLVPNLLEHNEFMNQLYSETDSYVHSDLLNAQDVLWQMQNYIKDSITYKAYWMCGYVWGPNDRSAEFLSNGIWIGGSNKGNTNSVIKKMKPGDIILLKSAYTKGSDHKTPVVKIIAVGTVLSKPEPIDSENYTIKVDYRKFEPKEFTNFKGSYMATIHRVADAQFIAFADNALSNSNETTNTMEYRNPSVKVREIMKLLNNAGQIILQGAPGCGKTFITTELAVALCDGQVPVQRTVLKARYRELQKAGRIGFTTFHQSLDYEDFVEGLKPDTETTTDEMRFVVKPGIFKRICEAAKSKETSNFEEAYAAFINDIGDTEEIKVITTLSGTRFGVSVNSNGNLALYTGANLQQNGVLTKEKIEHHLNNKYWQTYYTGIHNYLIENYNLSEENKPEDLPYVLIIDEINRANISKVLGELITLLEKSKRLGAEDEVTATLPYSGDVFGVPQNLYIIGTMNTADRSVGYIDYAIRRRFAFMTLKSDIAEITDLYKGALEPLYFKERDLYTKVRTLIKDNLNKEFELDDIMIGHSYFISQNEEDYTMNLTYKIKPLLLEYLRDGILVEKGTEVAEAIKNL